MWDRMFQRKLERMRRRGERQKAKSKIENKYAQYYPSKRRKVSNVMLVVIVTAITIYTIASFWLTFVSGVGIDSTLTTCFFAFWGSELVALATLKTSKIIKGSSNRNKDADNMSYEESDEEEP